MTADQLRELVALLGERLALAEQDAANYRRLAVDAVLEARALRQRLEAVEGEVAAAVGTLEIPSEEAAA
jgi:hypothetical protein